MRLSPYLRFVSLALLPLLGGCIFTTHRTHPLSGDEYATGRPLQWSVKDRAFTFHHRALTTYQRSGVYPIGFHYFSGWMRPLEPIPRLPTLLLELPFAWTARTEFDITVLDRTPQAAAVTVRDMPYYGGKRSSRYGDAVSSAFAHPMFRAYRRIFEKEIDFEKGDEAMAARRESYSAKALYLRTYERWLADHVPVLAWQDYDGGENLLLRRPEGLDHYRDLKLVQSIKMELPFDALFDTIDGENVYILFRGWAENRYFDAIPTSRKGSCIVKVLNLTTGACTEYGRFGDIPEAGVLPRDLEIRIEATELK